MHNIVDTSKLSGEYLDLEEQDVSGSMSIVVPEMKTNIKNITCIVEDSVTKTFSCAIINSDEKFYLLQLQFDPNVKKINLLTYTSFFKFKMVIGGTISLSKNYVAITGQDLSSRKRQVLVYSRKIKDAERRILTPDEEFSQVREGNQRILQKALVPEYPYLYYAIDLPIQHSEMPLKNYQFFLFEKPTQVPNPDTKSDVKTVTQNIDKLAIQTLNEPGMAKIYKIQAAELTFKRMGYYEMQDMKKINLQFEGGTTKIKKGIFQIFFDVESLGNINTQDKESWDGLFNFFSKLKWFAITIGCLILLVGLLAGCYCMRREKLKMTSV